MTIILWHTSLRSMERKKRKILGLFIFLIRRRLWCLSSFLDFFSMQLCIFFGSLNVISNSFFQELVSIQAKLSQLYKSEDFLLDGMTRNMMIKFEKF